MAELFELVDLRSALQLSVDEFDTDAASVARRHAYGWLQDATGLADWPDPVPDRLWAWAVELAAIAYRNPDAAQSEAVDDYKVVWDRQRRAEILQAAREAFATAGQPQGSFPQPDWHWTAEKAIGQL